jgi:hypothetical protein
LAHFYTNPPLLACKRDGVVFFGFFLALDIVFSTPAPVFHTPQQQHSSTSMSGKVSGKSLADSRWGTRNFGVRGR